jgi:hypothetical protein
LVAQVPGNCRIPLILVLLEIPPKSEDEDEDEDEPKTRVSGQTLLRSFQTGTGGEAAETALWRSISFEPVEFVPADRTRIAPDNSGG